jgi:TetR/AcrR family transcriptional regulator
MEMVEAAAEVIRGWVAEGKIAPVEPIYLLFNVWALTQHYADYESQVRFFTRTPKGPLARDTIRREITALVRRGVVLTPATAPAGARARTSTRKA